MAMRKLRNISEIKTHKNKALRSWVGGGVMISYIVNWWLISDESPRVSP